MIKISSFLLSNKLIINLFYNNYTNNINNNINSKNYFRILNFNNFPKINNYDQKFIFFKNLFKSNQNLNFNLLNLNQNINLDLFSKFTLLNLINNTKFNNLLLVPCLSKNLKSFCTQNIDNILLYFNILNKDL